MTLVPVSCLAPKAANAARFLCVCGHCGFLPTIVQPGDLYSDVGHTLAPRRKHSKIRDNCLVVSAMWSLFSAVQKDVTGRFC